MRAYAHCKVHEINERKCYTLFIWCVSMIIEWILVKFGSVILTCEDAGNLILVCVGFYISL